MTEPELLSGGDMLIRSLADEGVEHLWGYPGGAALHIYDAIFRQDRVRHILVRHEQAATHAADGYARSSGKPGVVLVTSGPGATNAITGIATAYMDSIPMVVISGQVVSDRIGEDAFQETDMVGISRPIVKHSFLIKNAADIPETIKKAFHIATTGRPGPVVVDVPKDITNPVDKFPYVYPSEVSLRSYNPAQKGHAGQIKKAIQLLLAAKKPVFYAGGGVILGGASKELTKLARALNVPVTNTLMGLGCFPGSDDQFLGMLGMHGTVEANLAMHNADVIFALGARFDDRVTNTPDLFCPDAKIVHVDIDPATISKIITADIPIVGDIKSVLNDMLELVVSEKKALEPTALQSWWAQINAWRDQYSIYRKPNYEATGSIKPQEVVKALYEVTEGKAYVCSDVGQHQMFSAQYYFYDQPRQWINSGGLGTMGFGLPAAMGVQMAFPDAPVACVTGEGSIQMCIQELATCSQYNLPVKIICINNQSLGMVKQWQDMQYGGRHSESLYKDTLPDFPKLMEAYGHVGIKVTKREELIPALKKCFEMKDQCVFMDIYVDPSVHVYPMLVAPNGSMKDMLLSKEEQI